MVITQYGSPWPPGARILASDSIAQWLMGTLVKGLLRPIALESSGHVWLHGERVAVQRHAADVAALAASNSGVAVIPISIANWTPKSVAISLECPIITVRFYSKFQGC